MEFLMVLLSRRSVGQELSVLTGHDYKERTRSGGSAPSCYDQLCHTHRENYCAALHPVPAYTTHEI